ncbi:MAG TPA: hypothetical protein ENJ00_07160 [Phycisphaerales bacterium]|nr:hypothetical protein [Phycisphaerales bacterium]
MPESASNPTPAPLGFVLAVTFTLSIGTGALTHGLYFLAEASCQFNRTNLFALGVVFGAAYIPATRFAGPLVRLMERSSTIISPRMLLIGITLTGALLSLIPPVLALLRVQSCWALWLLAAGYAAITGLLWPIVEWYISGGRTGRQLRSAVGQFNIAWTSAVVLAFWLIGPTLEARPLDALVGVAGLHALAVLLILPMPTHPARHRPESHTSHHARRGLLVSARILLPTSYMLAGVLGPFFPVALTSMNINLAWQTVLVSVWMTSRIPTMLLLQRWHGWHGKVWPVALGGSMLAAGFIGCIIAPAVPNHAAGLAVMIVALTLFGSGMGVVYTAAIYYAMEFGHGQIDSNATHESLVGLGYILGPGVGLAISLTISVDLLDERYFLVTLILATLVAAGGLAMLLLASEKTKQ